MDFLQLKEIFGKFRAAGKCQKGYKTGSGHIHTTWLIETDNKDQPDYILQKINHHVFPPVDEMMENIRKVTAHLHSKNKNGNYKVLDLVPSISGASYYTDDSGDRWRMYIKISPGVSYDVIPNNKIAYEAGKAFGRFISDLGDMPASEIFPVIPDFHSMEMRYNQFRTALGSDPLGRSGDVRGEIEFVTSRIEDMLVIPRLEKEGKLPLRITHNDTKLNNVLFDNEDNAVCVIDLDTVMPGLSLYDFGDTIRTAANTAEEDEADTSRIGFSIPVFTSFSEGFLKETLHFLTPDEIYLMPLSARYMTFIMGLRFLTDYIAGDVYYSIHHPSHNLVRSRAQFRLVELMEEKHDECEGIIGNIVKNYRN